MFKKSIQIVRKSIFPLFYYGPQGKYGVQGTGFFIDDKGHFLTAAHVVKNLPRGTQLGYVGNIPLVNIRGGGFQKIQITSIDQSKDLALGKIESNRLEPLSFAKNDALVGESISLCGYPLPEIKPSKSTTNGKVDGVIRLNLDVTNVRQYWQPTIKMDSLSKGMLYGKSFNSFITQHAALPGMSGGPVFNVDGDVVGLTSAVWTRKIPITKINTIQVENGIGVALDEIKLFLKSALIKEAA